MTEPETPDKEPKIIIDDDWKEQVAKEKAAASESATADDAPVHADESNQAEVVEQTTDDPSDQANVPPPATFDVLVSMLFTQAMATLGHLPNPATGKAEVNKPYAKHYIDTLEMLDDKTKGNLTEEESKILSDALHALRMAYVDTKA